MADFTESQSKSKSDNKINKVIYFFWVGFLVYSLSYTISTSDSVNYILCQLLQIIGLFLLITSALILMKWKIDTTYLKLVFTLYIFWLLTVIVRGFFFDYKYIKFLLFDASFGIFLYFVPLILLFPRDLAYYKKIFDVIVIFGFAYILYDIMFIKDLLFIGRNLKSQGMIEYFSLNLSIESGFLLLTFVYQSKKRRILGLIVILLTFILAAIRARRGLMFMSLNIMVVSFFMYYYAHKVKILFFFISIILIVPIYILGAKIYNDNSSGLFGYITKRVDEKTRSGVEEYFYNDMRPVDWLVGKGINGQYYCPVIENGSLTVYRGVIETGYLQIILKGGVVSLGLLLLIAIPAMIKGIFFSKNMFSKAAGIWILLFLIDLYPATPTTFSMNYILVWLSIGICYSKDIRNMEESEVAGILSNKTTLEKY